MSKKERINEIIKEAEENKNKDKDKSKIVKEFLIIDINSNFFALQLEYLREIFDLTDKDDIVPIPFTPQYILGIINVRGEIIPALSLLRILEIEDKNFNNYLKIAIIDEKFKIAFPFTEIIDIKPIKNATKKNKDQFLTSEFEYGDKIISIIDIIKIYSSNYLL